MFVDLMNDIYHTFTERFLRMQIVFQEAPPPMPVVEVPRPRRRYDAMGILRDVDEEEAGGGSTVLDVAPPEPPANEPQVRRDPLIVGGGRARSLSDLGNAAVPGVPNGKDATDWSSIGRNDPCPCGSGRKFKKCHGANA